MRKITKLLLAAALLIGAVSVKANDVKIPIELTGAIEGVTVTPIDPLTLDPLGEVPEHIYAAKFTTSDQLQNVIQYKNMSTAEAVAQGCDRIVIEFGAAVGDAWRFHSYGGQFDGIEEIGGETSHTLMLDGDKAIDDFTIFNWVGSGVQEIIIKAAYFYKADSSKKLPVDLSTLPATSENTTWEWDGETSTGTFAWSQTSYNSTELFGSGNYSGYTTLNLVTTAGTADHFRIILKFTNGAGQVTINPVAAGTVSLNLADYTTAENLANVSTIRLSGANDCTGNITVSDVYLEGPDVTYIEAVTAYEAPAGTTDLNDIAGTYTALMIDYPKELKGQAATLCGDGDGSNEAGHADISDYDYLCFEISSVSGGSSDLRVWIWDGEKVVTLRPHPIADYATVDDWTAEYSISTPGTYAVKISDYDHLKGVKTNWGSSANMMISMVYLSKGSAPVAYIPSGKYTLVGEVAGSYSLVSALGDVNATCFDATGVTGTDVDLTGAANPNALFIAKDVNVLSNNCNVIVNDLCDDLFLTDGFAFKAPADFMAAHVSYKRAFSGEKATVCLPFALTSDEVANIGTFYALSSFDGSTLHFTSVDATEANTPYLVVASSHSLGFDGSDVDVPATPASLAVSAGNAEFIGTMADTTVPASDAAYSYYAYNNGQFVKVVDADAKLRSFRGYFKVANSGDARLLNVSFDDATTGIETLQTVNNGEQKVYDLNGRRVSTMQKGVYVVNGKKVIK